MQITLLSVASIILTILKCHNVIIMDWWIVFLPVIIDFVIAFCRYCERKREEELFLDAMIECLNKKGDD